MSHLKNIWRLLFLITVLSACSTEPEPIVRSSAPPKPPVELNGPADIELYNSLDGNVKGYQYITMKDGEIVNERSGGYARNAIDGGESMTNDHQFNVASISKFITTIAVLQQLEKFGIDVRDSIGPYLPKTWVRGNGIDEVTFLELLSQSAGLVKVGRQTYSANAYDSLRYFVEQGASSSMKFPRYSNTNHAMFRVILPILVDSMTIDSDEESDAFTAMQYESIVQTDLFDPLDIKAAMRLESPLKVFAYNGPNDSGPGNGNGVEYKWVGGGYGWHISSHDLAMLWAKVWYTEDVISLSSRQLLLDYYAGLFETRRSPGAELYTKDGWWYWGGEVSKHYRCVAMHMESGYDVIIFINSDFSSIVDFAWGLRDELLEGQGA